MPYPVVGKLTVSPGGIGARVGFSQFTDPPGIQGLARVNGDRLDVLAILATPPGRGHLTAFLSRAMQAYQTIVVWEVQSDILAGALRRRGFADCQEWTPLGQYLPVLRWDRPTNRS